MYGVTTGANSPSARLHAIAVELAAMAQNGLNYATDRYDTARYVRMRALSAEVLALLSGVDAETFVRSLAAERGHATPKVDVRGALFDADDRVLLVREARDGRWTLPGGWADALDTPTQACAREFAEEAGVRVQVLRLAAVHDGSRRNGHGASPWHVYKLMFLVERLDDAAPRAGLDGETTGVDFFDCDDLPPLSSPRSTTEQLLMLRAHHRDPLRVPELD